MQYQKFSISNFFTKINSEPRARELVWEYRFGKAGFECPHCQSKAYHSIKTRPEVRQCAKCRKQIRLRANTMFEHSKIPMLTWVRAIYLMMSGKRGVSALELQRQLDLNRYETAWNMLHKIRNALQERDEKYSLSGIIELDATGFGKQVTDNQETVLVAIEQKDWIDEKGNPKRKAGFAKVLIGKEDKETAAAFIEKEVEEGSFIKTDGARAHVNNHMEGYKVKSIATYNDPEVLDFWLPWVHKFISNAKTWILGTHHGVGRKYLKLYLSEYTYRFNRRHDVRRMFSRALRACCKGSSTTLYALSG
jgi:transposase-like protein